MILSLRARLLLGVIVLAAIGLVTADVLTYTSLRNFLIQRADESLEAAQVSVSQVLPTVNGQTAVPDNASTLVSRLEIIGDCVSVRRLDGRVPDPKQPNLGSQCLSQLSQSTLPPSPRLPAVISVPASTKRQDGSRVRFFTVPATTLSCRIPKTTTSPSPAGVDVPRGSSTPATSTVPPSSAGEVPAKCKVHTVSTQYRVRASVESAAPGFMLVIAAPLTGVVATLHRLLVVELLVTGGVLLALAVLGLYVVRLGLRPLEEIEETAAAIAGGDLSRRIEYADDATEVGRLGATLNSMLNQIEAAFHAREATEQKLRRFVADASHELRTPLAAVRAYAELFSRGAAQRPDDLERSMHGISRESERMTVMVDELILLAHLDDGRPLLHEAVDLEGVVADSVETARTVEPERPIEIQTVPAVVIGDHDRLRQLVDNLLSNVRAHTPPTASARVVLRRSEGNAVLEVSDTGPGMRADELAHVFERFFRTDRSRTRSSGGSGLGLAIVAALAEAHGGTAVASSTLGEGSTFTISIPLAEPQPNGDGSIAAAEREQVAESAVSRGSTPAT